MPILGVQFRHQLHLECELKVEKMWGGGGKAGSTLEPALVHPITEHWRATIRGGKGPSTLAGLFQSTYLKLPKWDKKNGQNSKMGPEMYLDIFGPLCKIWCIGVGFQTYIWHFIQGIWTFIYLFIYLFIIWTLIVYCRDGGCLSVFLFLI
jgi:hypothetical protein